MKVDVAINVYGKPYQTLCTIKSLLKHSGQWIDNIYITSEIKHPYNDYPDWIFDGMENIFIHKPNNYIHCRWIKEDYSTIAKRLNVRYQYGIESSDKKYLFISHNDVLYKDDIIGKLLENIGENVGIGAIGMCWNCPPWYDKLCNPDIVKDYKPTYNEVCESINRHPNHRTKIERIDKLQPYPLPECRLNEWCCLINREVTINECYPNSDTPLFGVSEQVDTACAWYRSLVLKGYNFKNYNIYDYISHGYWAGTAGYPTEQNEIKYWEAEEKAKEYFNKNFK